MQLPLNSTADYLCKTGRMQLKRKTVTTWQQGGNPQIKLSAGEITIDNIKIIIKPVNEAKRWVIMASIIIVGRCLLLPSFRRETEGTDCTRILLPSNYDPRRTRKSTTKKMMNSNMSHDRRFSWMLRSNPISFNSSLSGAIKWKQLSTSPQKTCRKGQIQLLSFLNRYIKVAVNLKNLCFFL